MKNKIFTATLVVFVLVVARSLFGQSIVFSTQGRSIVLSTNVQPAVVEKPADFVEVETPKPVVLPPVVEVQETSGDYVVVFTTTNCPPCMMVKNQTIPELRRRKIRVREISDSSIAAQYGVTRFPVVMLAKNKKQLRRWTGFVSAETICQSLTTSVQPAVIRSLPVQQRTSGVMYGGSIYTGRVCSNPNCRMCNQIQRGLSIQYQPMSIKVTPAQEGTPHDLVEQMLDAMSLGRDDILADLGCGDGRVLIAAANRGIRGIGVEIDPVVAERARRNVESSGMGHLVTIETGDVRDFDSSRCTAITAYLYPTLLAELSAMMRSVRVVGSPFHAVHGLNMTQHGDVWLYRREG